MRLNIFYILLIALCGLYGCKNHQQPIIKENLNILPTIYPEYQGALLPVNIAPLNFKIQDEGDEWMIQIQGKGNPITITAHDAVEIPIKRWTITSSKSRRELKYHRIQSKKRRMVSIFSLHVGCIH